MKDTSPDCWVDGLALVEDLKAYLQSIAPAVPTALSQIRRIDAFLAEPNQESLSRKAERMRKDETVRHGYTATPSGLPVLAVEVSGGTVIVVLPDIPEVMREKLAERDDLVMGRLRVNGREVFTLNDGPLPERLRQDEA